MNKTVILLAGLLLCFAAPVLASDYIDLRGDWQCVATGVIRGENLHAEGAGEQVQFIELDVLIQIEEQQDRRFYGTKTAGSGTEHIIGMLSRDGATALEADHDGTAEWRFQDENSFHLDYMHSWGSTKMAVFNAECERDE